jgi:hypothetical protein
MDDNNVDVTYGYNYFRQRSIQCILAMTMFSILTLFFLDVNIISNDVSATIESSYGSATPTQPSNQLLVEYSYTKNPVKIGEKTFLLITVKDKFSDEPIPDAFVKLAIGPSLSTIRNNILSMALSAVSTTPAQKLIEAKTMQMMHTDGNGYAAFTIQLGIESDVGLYDTEIEVSNNNYQSSFSQVDLNVISESQQDEMSSNGNNDGDAIRGNAVGGDGGDAVGGDGGDAVGGDGGDAVGGNAIAGNDGDAIRGNAVGGDGGDAVGGNAIAGNDGDAVKGNAIAGDGGDAVGGNAIAGDGGDAVGGNAIAGDGGDGGEAIGLVLDGSDCNDTPIGGDGGGGGDAVGGNRGKDVDDGTDEMLLC